MSYVNNIPTVSDPDLNIDESNNLISAYAGDSMNHTEPFADIFYPILNTSGNPAGVVSVTFFWRDMLNEILPEENKGLQVVLENTCNQTFTYTWSESELQYLGEGDVHEGEFDDRGISYPLSEGGMDSEVQLFSNGCQYTILTYPSSDMHADFKQSKPK